MSGYSSGTVKAAENFDAERDAQVLKKAFKGMGCDKEAVVRVIANCNNAQRQEIATAYKNQYGKDLNKDLESELKSDLEKLILALMVPSEKYDAFCLKNAIKGAGTDESCLTEIICSRTEEELQVACQAYEAGGKSTLEKDIRGDTSGHYERLLVSLVQPGGRQGGYPDKDKAQEDAKVLFEAGEKKLGTDESAWNRIFATRSWEQLKLTFEEYVHVAHRDIEKAIEKEFSGHLKEALMTIVKVVKDRNAYFAERLYKSMKGAGTDDRTLIRNIVSRSERDLLQVKQSFEKQYGKTLHRFIEGDCSGDYKKCLLTLIAD